MTISVWKTIAPKARSPETNLSCSEEVFFIWIIATCQLPCNTSILLFSHLGRVWCFVTPWTVAWQASLSFTISWSLFKLMPVESVMPSIHLILCLHLILFYSVFPSIRVFSSESALRISGQSIRASPSASVLSMHIQGTISFGIDWFGLLTVQGLSRVFSRTTVWKYQFFGIQSSFWSNSHIHT